MSGASQVDRFLGLTFRNGVIIDDPLRYALLFLEKDYSYKSYDLNPVAHDSTVTLDDIRVANRIGGRMSASESVTLFERRAALEDALSRIPADASLCAPTDDIPWVALADLFASADGVKGIGLPKLTKFLHKKRPALIPILDSVVEDYLRSVDESVPKKGLLFEIAGPALVRSYKVDLDANLNLLREVRAELEAAGYALSECRILDIFTWAYAGELVPGWSAGVHPRDANKSLEPALAVSAALGSRFESAVQYALHVHGGHRRKGTEIPYIAHLLSVAALVLEDGGDEDEAIAALLHDAVEDGGGVERLADVRYRFGHRVAEIVKECSDTDVTPKPPWRERKEAYVAHLETASDSAIRVSLADKVHNARSIVRDYREIGASLWERFHPDSDQCWYYGALLAAFEARDAGPMVEDLRGLVAAMKRMEDASRRVRLRALARQAPGRIQSVVRPIG